jgi:hypothetical protein
MSDHVRNSMARGRGGGDGPRQHALRTFLGALDREDVGDGLTDPAAARAALSAEGLVALARCQRRLRRSWLHRRPHLEAAAAVQELDGGSRVVLYPAGFEDTPRWIAHTLDGGRPSSTPLVNQEELPRLRSYVVDGVDPFANRPVGLGPLLARRRVGDPSRAAQRLFLPNGVQDQLRMVIYRGRRASLFVGLFRPPGAPHFDRESHARLLAARPDLRAWSRVAEAIGSEPLGDGALTSMLAALDEPALLVRRRRVVFTNAAGRAWVEATRRWLAAGSPAGFGSVTQLAPRGLTVDLVLPRTSPAGDGLGELPPSLHKVASLLARGLADKEIASELALPLATVRTYVARVLKRLDARGRRELMMRLRAADPQGHGKRSASPRR